jgi:hypothetical protein
LFYATMGIPIAHLSDHYSRPLIIGAGVFLWSAATLIASTAGVLTSGWLNDRLQRNGHLDAPLRTGAVGGAGLVAPVVLLPWAHSLPVALALFGKALFFVSFPMPAVQSER